MTSEKADEIINQLCTMSDRQLDQSMVQKLKVAYGAPVEKKVVIIAEVLDLSAHGSLASGFTMTVLDILFKELGGPNMEFERPWRKETAVEA